MNYGIILACFLELIGCSAVPLPLYTNGATPALRAGKPLGTLAVCYVLSKHLNVYAGLAYVVAQVSLGFVAHRRFCASNGKANWLGTTSPFLFRNPGQIKAWSTIAA